MARPEAFDFARPDDDWATLASRRRDTPVKGLAELRRLTAKFAYGAVLTVQAFTFWPMRWRAAMLRSLGLRLSHDTYIADRCYFKGFGLITEGKVVMNTGCHLDAAGQIILEDGTGLACEVMIVTSSHEIGDETWRAGPVLRKPVRICSGAWIGARAMILPGVTVAPGCVIAAGAVVTKDTEPNGIYAGTPARRIRDIGATVHHLPTQPVFPVPASLT